jgi:ATP-dependent DNA ligase
MPSLLKQSARFIETMDRLHVARLPEGPEWTCEIELDGYRLQAVRSADPTTLYSRRQNVLNAERLCDYALPTWVRPMKT